MSARGFPRGMAVAMLPSIMLWVAMIEAVQIILALVR
jgi:hypothetical protein